MKGLYKTNGRAGQKGQSLIEYVVLVAAVLGILIIFLRPGGLFSKKVTNVVEGQGRSISNMAIQVFR